MRADAGWAGGICGDGEEGMESVTDGAKEAVTCEWIQPIRETITHVKLNYLYVSPLEKLAVRLQIGLKAPPTMSCWRINSAPLLSRNGLCFHLAKRAKESSFRRRETPRPVSPAAKALSAVNCTGAGQLASQRAAAGVREMPLA